MAARQDQGLQIALSIFVFLFVVFAALTYVFYKSSSDTAQELASTEQRRRDAESTSRTLQSQNEALREMIGFSATENTEEVQTTFDSDMQRYGETFDESQQSYRAILEYVFDENEKIAAREVAAKQDIESLTDSLLQLENQKEQQVAQFEQQMRRAESDAAAQRASFDKDRQQLEATKQELLENLDKQRSAFQATIADLTAKLKDVNEKLTKSERAKEILLGERELASDKFERSDGRISWVNQRDATVWINLGSADSLRRQVTFSVFDTNDPNASNAEHKGSIEVMRILGDHLAEAKITEDDARNPIIAGDQIFSTVWHKGKKQRFALTGIIDVDGDGKSDMQLARDLIELHGAVVDAYLGDDGRVEGEMSVQTRYLVLGDFPEGTREADLRSGWEVMNDDAATLGVETITLEEFLNQMGYVPQDRTVPLGAGAKASDFRPRSPNGQPTATPY